MYIEYRSYFLFNRFYQILYFDEKTYVFLVIFEELSGGFVLESWFSYLLSYLIDKRI